MNRSLPLVAVLVLSACQARADNSSKVDGPAVTVVYSPRFDSVCSLVRGGAVQDAWVSEMTARTPEFERDWAAVGPGLIRATEEVTGAPFPSGPFRVRLTLCNVPSQSMLGTSVNMRYALESFAPEPVPMRYKVDTLFHELLHAFLAEHPIEASVLLREHASEPERTRDHLHLLALQKAVLLHLGQTDDLRDVIEIDSQLPGGFYERAWEIVNETPTTYLEYVAEIRP